MTNSGAQQYDDEKFEAAFQAALQLKKRDHPSFIGGMKVASGLEFAVKSPIDNTIGFGTFQEPEKGTADMAVELAAKVHPTWAGVPLDKRKSYFADLLEMVKNQRYRLAAMVLLSSGMSRQESVMEVDRLIEVITECIAVKEIKRGRTGVWGIITSFNSPLASPVGHAVAAMIAGNSTVIMPSKYCPLPVFMIYDMMESVGVPSGVMNLIVDRKDSSYEQLANNPEIEGVLISGSAEYLEEMIFLQVDDELKVLNELKGMNPIIVHKPGDLKNTVDLILSSAFKYSGQRLFSTSMLIVTSEDNNKIVNMLLEKAKDLKISDPADADTFSGPLISEESEKHFLKKTGSVKGNIIFGAKKIIGEYTSNGSYYSPAIIAGLDPDNEMMYMDSGLPILCIKTVNSFEEALLELEEIECGLSAGLMSKDPKAIERFISEADVKFKFINESSMNLKPAVYARPEEFLK